MAFLTESERVFLNKMNSTALRTRLGDKLNLQKYVSAAGVGGGATEALVVTGLAADDTILGVTQKTSGANNLPLLGYTTQAANALTCVWSGDPDAGAVVEVLVLKAPATKLV